MDNANIDLIGAIIAVVFYISAIFVFIFRLMRKPRISKWIGIFEFCLAIPMVYLLIEAPSYNRPPIYYIQVGLLLLWMLVELLLDYIFVIDFRHTQWMVVSYVTLFFAGTGGMLGIASHAGRYWSIASIMLFLIMAVLAFVQRRITGM